MVDTATGTIYQYLNDRLGTPVALVDSGNKAVWEAVYKPFGEATVNPNSSVSEAPPAERVASGSPPEGGVYIGKAPLGLLVIKI
jgi:hypothetical protein